MPEGGRKPNRLIGEHSAYLLQHAYNPVNWYPWGEEAFARAKAEDKPIFLSIGYSACHWCHVMERESFDDQEVAQLLNENFICIKVDKEERPDIDSVYMAVCQVFTGQGGWPCTVLTTPDQRPFFAGTYFPKDKKYNTPGLMQLLPLAADSWKTRRKELETTADQVIQILKDRENPKPLEKEASSRHPSEDSSSRPSERWQERQPGNPSHRQWEYEGQLKSPSHCQSEDSSHCRWEDPCETSPEQTPLEALEGLSRLKFREYDRLIQLARCELEQNFDEAWGGFGREPKFPLPHNLLFLLELYQSSKGKDRKALEMAEKTLLALYKGGIFDQIGGGFCRYSTDRKWLVPHFEKMLYDNALLLMAYVKGYEITHRECFRRVAEMTADYVLREMTSPEGGFYTAQDADSEGEEGKYYTFVPSELISVLGEQEGKLFCSHYNITSQGNFEGRSIPNLLESHRRSDQTSGSKPGKDCGISDQTNGSEAGKPCGISDQADGSEPETTRSINDPSIGLKFRKVSESITGGSSIDTVNAETGEQIMEGIRQRVLEYRIKRMSLHRDEKILPAWNGLMIGALAKACQVLGNRRYLEAAEKALRFAQEQLTVSVGQPGGKRGGQAPFHQAGRHSASSVYDGGEQAIHQRGSSETVEPVFSGVSRRLCASYGQGKAKGTGFLDDYAFLGFACLCLHQACGKVTCLQKALDYTVDMTQLFFDWGQGGFYLTGRDQEQLIFRPRETCDGALPSGNSVAAYNLVSLAQKLSGSGGDLLQAAGKQLQYLKERTEEHPSGSCFAMLAFLEAGAGLD